MKWYLIMLVISLITLYLYPKIDADPDSDDYIWILYPFLIVGVCTVYWTSYMMAEGIVFNLKLDKDLTTWISYPILVVFCYLIIKITEKRKKKYQEINQST